MKKVLSAIAGASLLLFSVSANAVPILQVAYGSLTGSGLVTFDDIAGGTAPGTNYDGIFESGGAAFGERFAGQTLGASGDFDVLSGSPSGPLALAAGAANENLNVVFDEFDAVSNVLAGLGNQLFPNFSAIGEGSVAVLFDFDQSEFGFRLVGGDGGNAYVNFFGRDGSLLDAITLSGLTDGYYGFQASGGVNQIAGVTITNDDLAGIGLDDLKHDVPGTTVPEPTTLTLLGLGLAGIGAIRRRIKK